MTDLTSLAGHDMQKVSLLLEMPFDMLESFGLESSSGAVYSMEDTRFLFYFIFVGVS